MIKKIIRIVDFIIYYAVLASIYILGVYLVIFMNTLHFYPWIIGIAYYYAISIIFAIVIFIQKRHQSAKLSWFLVLALLPIVGQLIYIVFGLRYKHRIPLSEYHKKDQFSFELINQSDKEHDDKDMDILLREQSNISKRGIYKADIQFFKHQDEGFDVLFEDLRNAKKFIHLEYYIIKPGEIFEQLREILFQKVKEGVEVRFIIDDFGQWGMPTRKVKEFIRNGVQIRKMNPINFPFMDSNNGFRTHRKYVIIDGRMVHTGGSNIADEYVNINKRFGWWIDYHAKITGEFVRSYGILFFQDWEFCGPTKLDNENGYLLEETTGESHAVLVEETPENEEKLLLNSYLKWILSAKKEIKIATPYFVPVPEVIQALKTAALSGVKVKIYIPGRADKKSVFLASMYNANELSKYGIEFYQAKSMLIHSKIATFDGKYAYFGTANLDYRSIHSQFETANLVVGKAVNDINDMFDMYEPFVKKVEFENHNKPFREKWYIRVFVQVFAPMM